MFDPRAFLLGLLELALQIGYLGIERGQSFLLLLPNGPSSGAELLLFVAKTLELLLPHRAVFLELVESGRQQRSGTKNEHGFRLRLGAERHRP